MITYLLGKIMARNKKVKPLGTQKKAPLRFTRHRSNHHTGQTEVFDTELMLWLVLDGLDREHGRACQENWDDMEKALPTTLCEYKASLTPEVRDAMFSDPDIAASYTPKFEPVTPSASSSQVEMESTPSYASDSTPDYSSDSSSSYSSDSGSSDSGSSDF